MNKVAGRLLVVALVFLGSILGGFIFAWAQTATHRGGSGYFPDCSATSPHDQDIGWAYEAGIVSGFGDGSYNPALPVTREQMTSYTVRTMVIGSALAVLVVDNAYCDGANFGLAAYNAGRITWDQYQQYQRVGDWYVQLLAYQISQGNTTRITAARPETLRAPTAGPKEDPLLSRLLEITVPVDGDR